MSTPRKVDTATLARYFPDLKGKVTTADKIPIPASKPPALGTSPRAGSPIETLAKEKVRWTKELRYALELFAPHALYVAATAGPASITLLSPNGDVRRRLGHNNGCWPVKVGTTSSATPWREKVSSFLDTGPYDRIVITTWLWLADYRDANALALHAGAILKCAAEEAGFAQLENGYTDAGPAFRSVDYTRHIQMLARRGVKEAPDFDLPALPPVLVWSTEGLHEFLSKTVEAAKQKGLQLLDPHDRKIGGDMASSFVKLVDRMVEKERERQFPGRS